MDDDGREGAALRAMAAVQGYDGRGGNYWEEGLHESYESYGLPTPGHYSRSQPPDSIGRLRHQILVDGRLVDSWTESVEGTRWQGWAQRFDDERCRHERMPPPMKRPDPWETMLDWLDALVGGRPALEALDSTPCDDPSPTSSVTDDPPLHDVTCLVMDAAGAYFPDGAPTVLRRALVRLWEDGRDLVSTARSPEHLAGGVCWAIGRANGWFQPTTNVRQKDVQTHLHLGAAISTTGTSIVRVLRDLGPVAPRCPTSYPDLLALGDAALLTAETRSALVGWRDKALAARDACLAKEELDRVADAPGSRGVTPASG